MKNFKNEINNEKVSLLLKRKKFNNGNHRHLFFDAKEKSGVNIL